MDSNGGHGNGEQPQRSTSGFEVPPERDMFGLWKMVKEGGDVEVLWGSEVGFNKGKGACIM